MNVRMTVFETKSSNDNVWNYYECQGLKHMYKDIDWMLDELNRLKDLGFTCIDNELAGFKFLSKHEEIQIKLELENQKHNRIISELNEELKQYKNEI
jgi:hypothetical protein